MEEQAHWIKPYKIWFYKKMKKKKKELM